MPRFFDDYSNTYLTHDSAAGRKQQRRGWKFRENFKLYYEKHLEEWRKGPMGLASAQQGYLRSNANNPAAMIPPLPEDWEEELDGATRCAFYTNKKTQERTWVRPEFIPPPAMGRGMPPMMGTNRSGVAPNSFRDSAGPPPPPPMGRGPPPPPFQSQPNGPVGQPMRGFTGPPPPRGGPGSMFLPPPPMGFPPPPPR